MERKKMKRVNVILEADLYDKARIVAFVKRKSLSAIVRGALSEWLKQSSMSILEETSTNRPEPFDLLRATVRGGDAPDAFVNR